MTATMALARNATQAEIPHRVATGREAKLIKLRIGLETVQGKWISDDTVGLPYDRWSARPAVPDVEIEAEVRALLGSYPDVVSRIVSVEIARDNESLLISPVVVLAEETEEIAIAISATTEYDDPRILARFYTAKGHEVLPKW